jgi:hypothetical protein
VAGLRWHGWQQKKKQKKNILWPFGVGMYFIVIWYIFPVFGMLYQEKSGNPAVDRGQVD